MMTLQHIFYIPTIFLLGMVFGSMINERVFENRSIKLGGSNVKNLKTQYKTSAKLLLQTFVIFLLTFAITHLFEIPWGSKAVSRLLGDIEIFDKSPVFSSAEVYERLSKFSTSGIILYKRFTYTIDILFPLSFLAFLVTYARFIRERLFTKAYAVAVMIYLPVFWFAFDLIENTMIFYILTIFPAKNEILGGSLGFVTLLKFIFLLSSILMPSVFYIVFKRPKQTNSTGS